MPPRPPDCEDPALEELQARPRQALPVTLNGYECVALVDSGNTFMSLISAETCREMGIPLSDLSPCVDGTDRVGTADEAASIRILGQVPRPLKLQLGDNPTKLSFRPAVAENLAARVNLGASFLRKHQLILDFGKGVLRHQGHAHELHQSVSPIHPPRGSQLKRIKVPLHLAEDVVLLPRTQTWVPVTGPGLEPGAYLVWGKDEGKKDLFFPRNTLVRASDDRLLVPILNAGQKEVSITRDTAFGVGESMAEAGEGPGQRPLLCQINRGSSRPKGQASTLSPEERDLRISRILEEFKLAESPLLKDPQDLAQAVALILRHYDVFAWEGELGSTDLLKHDIKLSDESPIRLRARPLNPALTKDLQEQVDKWLRAGVIEPSASPFNFQLVPVLKKNGKTRWCVDFRNLNERTLKDPFPIGDIQSNMAYLHGSTVFSTMDALSAFHAVELTDRAKPLTAFSTPSGHYHFVKLPFGLTNAPATYSRLVQLTLAKVPATMALPYLDDTLVHSKDMADHFPALDKVFDAFGQAGIKLEPAKCHLFQQELTYLGHKVSSEGVAPVPEYIKLVQDWPLPKTRKDLRAFMGKIGYYRRFIKDYSALSCPLNDKLTKDGTGETEEFEPSSDYIKAFETLRKKLTEAPILAHPQWDSGEPFILDTDWSATNRAIGCVLSQVQDGVERVIAYGGKRLTPAQANYSPFKGELFGLLDGIRSMRYFVLSNYFKVRSDHLPLNWIRKLGEPPSGSIQRWLDVISSYDFDVIPRKGTKHGNADALSRAPHLPQIKYVDYEDEKICQIHELTPEQRMVPSPSRLREAQERDPDLRPLLPHYTAGPCRSREEVVYEQLRESTRIPSPTAPVEYWSPSLQKWVPILPAELQETAIKAAHLSVGHLGDFATTAALAERCFFIGMRTKVLDLLKSCLACQTKTRPRPAQRHTLASQPASYPFQAISIDFVGPLPKARGSLCYLLTVKDRCTRWLEAIPTTGMTSSIVKTALMSHVFSRHGIPERIHADNATGFASEEFKLFCNRLGITLTFSPPYNPKSNPVERSHRDLNAMLTALCAGKPSTWIDHLPQALLAMRAATSSSTGHSPFYLVHGRRPRLPLDALIKGPPDAVEESVQVPAVEALREAFQQARLKETAAIERMATQYHGKQKSFTLGQRVWLFHPAPHRPKLDIWWTGPWTITQVINPLVYILAPDPAWEFPQRRVVAGIDRLREYIGPHETRPDPAWAANVHEPDFGDEIVANAPLGPPPPATTSALAAESGEDEDEPGEPREIVVPPSPNVDPTPSLSDSSKGPPSDLGPIESEPPEMEWDHEGMTPSPGWVSPQPTPAPASPRPAPAAPIRPTPAWLDLAAMSMPSDSAVPSAASTPRPPGPPTPGADNLSTISEESDVSFQRPNTPAAEPNAENPYARTYATTASDRAERMANRAN